MFRPDFYKRHGCEPRNDYTPILRPDYQSDSEPENLYKVNKYDADSFWDGETIDDESL